MASESQKRASSAYAKRTGYAAQKEYLKKGLYKTYTVRVGKETESEIFQKLESVENVSGYIKKLILDDLKKAEP